MKNGLAAAINDNKVVLSWNPATDDETPQNHLTYNLRVGTTFGGNEIISGAIPTGFGNMGCFLSKELNLPDGKYHWSVQAVDGAYVVSPWSKDRAFTIDHVIKGDVSGDGNIDVADAIFLLRSIAGLVQLDQQQSEAADVNGDGAVNVVDAIMILRFIAGLITEFPLS